MRLLFAGTPEIAETALRRLIDSGVTPVGILTNPDARAGRGMRLTPSPVGALAERESIPTLKPERLDAGARAAVAALHPELLVCVAYGRIFGPKFLALFPRGGINLHPSLLPRHRGPSPIQAAILAGDTVTGVTIQRLAAEMDAGDILLQRASELGPDETAGSLHDRLADEGATLLVDAVAAIAAGHESAVPQDHSAATYCGKISRDDAWLDWNLPADELARRVRAFTPWPGARFRWEGSPVIVTRATARAVSEWPPASGRAPEPGTVVGVDSAYGVLVQTGSGTLALTRLKPATRPEMDHAAFLNGNARFVGSVLGGTR